jgi:hypothetical protein
MIAFMVLASWILVVSLVLAVCVAARRADRESAASVGLHKIITPGGADGPTIQRGALEVSRSRPAGSPPGRTSEGSHPVNRVDPQPIAVIGPGLAVRELRRTAGAGPALLPGVR